MSKEECLKAGYYDPAYFDAAEDGWYYDRETGDRVAAWSDAPLT